MPRPLEFLVMKFQVTMRRDQKCSFLRLVALPGQRETDECPGCVSIIACRVLDVPGLPGGLAILRGAAREQWLRNTVQCVRFALEGVLSVTCFESHIAAFYV